MIAQVKAEGVGCGCRASVQLDHHLQQIALLWLGKRESEAYLDAAEHIYVRAWAMGPLSQL